jgi:hypothetical protein
MAGGVAVKEGGTADETIQEQSGFSIRRGSRRGLAAGEYREPLSRGSGFWGASFVRGIGPGFGIHGTAGMSRPVPLNRLSDISKQRSIRRPILVPLPIEGVEESTGRPKTKVEWPVPN